MVHMGIAPTVANAQAEAPVLARVTWYKEPGLRQLYAYCCIVCLASATTGYDGSMLNGLQILPYVHSDFQEYQACLS